MPAWCGKCPFAKAIVRIIHPARHVTCDRESREQQRPKFRAEMFQKKAGANKRQTLSEK